MSTPGVGLFVPLPAKTDKTADVEEFLQIGRKLVEDEPLTLQWYAIKYEQSEPVYAVFDTFAADEGRTAHLSGKIAEALMANATTLFTPGPEINGHTVLSSKVTKGDVKVGLRVIGEAKPEKVEEVKAFLTSAVDLVINEEPLTLQWYAVQFTSDGKPTNKFGIFDFAAAEAGRQAHLNGPVAAALFAKAGELFATPPELVKTEVLASYIV